MVRKAQGTEGWRLGMSKLNHSRSLVFFLILFFSLNHASLRPKVCVPFCHGNIRRLIAFKLVKKPKVGALLRSCLNKAKAFDHFH